MKNKRGSHVGMVLSFIIFVTFLLFLYSILSPSIKTERSKQNLLDYLKVELIENLSADLTVVTIRIDETYETPSEETCLEIQHYEDNDLNFIVKDQDDNTIDFGSSQEKIEIDWDDQEIRFFKIYYSEEEFEFNNPSPSLNNCAEPIKDEDYFIGRISTTEYVFYPKIQALIDNYKNDYEGVKQTFKISPESDFDFSFTDENEEVLEVTNEDVASSNIYAEEIPVQYFNSSADLNYGFLKIRVW